MHSGIVEANLSGHFSIFIIFENSSSNIETNEKMKITKRYLSDENTKHF